MSYCCYCLRSLASRRTYIGITNNLPRRLRQHNGEIKGGAKYTRAGQPWEVALYVTGFKCQREVLMFEWAWKHAKKNRAAGLSARRNQLLELVARQKWTSNSPPAKERDLHISWAAGNDPFAQAVLPKYVTQSTLPVAGVGTETGMDDPDGEWAKALSEWDAAVAEEADGHQASRALGKAGSQDIITTPAKPRSD